MSATTRQLPRANDGLRCDRMATLWATLGASLWCISPAPAQCPIELTEQWGGASYAAATDGTMAYTGIAPNNRPDPEDRSD